MRCFRLLGFSTVLSLMAGRGNSQINADPNTCTGNVGNKVQAALTEVYLMAAYAHDCTVAVRDLTRSDCRPLTAIFTFAAYFGRVAPNTGAAPDIVACMFLCSTSSMLLTSNRCTCNS